MAVVAARSDLYAANGKLLVAKKGRRGVAVRKATKHYANFDKVAVRWEGRLKLYWHWFDDLEFISTQLDPTAFIAVRPDMLLAIPPLPQPPEYYVYNFGYNLRHFREERGLSQRGLAEQLGNVAQTTVSYWERSETAPNGTYIRALSKVLNVPPFLFFVNFRDCEWLRRLRSYVNKLADSLCEEASI